MPSFSTTLEQAIHSALALANEHHHELATLEHLLLALTEEPDAVKVMRACNVDLDELRRMLVEFIEDDLGEEGLKRSVVIAAPAAWGLERTANSDKPMASKEAIDTRLDWNCWRAKCRWVT